MRPETPDDIAAIFNVHRQSFETPGEADLVNDLRGAGRLTRSLVAVVDSEVVGHVALSPVTVGGSVVPTEGGGLGLGPVAVLPTHRNQGIATQLVNTATAWATEQGYEFVVVLGSPAFYSRCGFSPAKAAGLSDEYGGGDAFQVKVLAEGGLIKKGLVAYAPEFAKLS